MSTTTSSSAQAPSKALAEITARIEARSRSHRQAYLNRMRHSRDTFERREKLSCGNFAHGIAACSTEEKNTLVMANAANVGIVTAYNDMLSAHQPYEHYPELVRQAARGMGCTAQVAGGVPAMCDGVTQGQAGMDLSLLSRDIIAMTTAIALSHNMFDSVVCLGICDKIVPGLFIGSLAFGYLPTVFLPAGPMPSGIPNSEKGRIRQLYAEGQVGRDELLKAEMGSYHSAGTCTFYGTANTNQMMMEFMGLQLPGGSFVNPGTPLRRALTTLGVEQAIRNSDKGSSYRPMMDIVGVESIVNAMVGLLATGGSTNHTIHLVAMAQAAGVLIDWQDFSDLSKIIPLMARVYPNGDADVNHFHAAGGVVFMIRELLEHGLLHDKVDTMLGEGLYDHYTKEPFLENDGSIRWEPGSRETGDKDILKTVAEPFQKEGGLELLKGNLGNSIIKVSAVADKHRYVRAPARVFHSQHEAVDAYTAGKLNQDVVVVLNYQGPKACGMPELHKLTPPLSSLQSKGFAVALVTDGRMSGASGKVPAAIHVSPEALDGGPISLVRDGDIIEVDSLNGKLLLEVDEAELERRRAEIVVPDLSANEWGLGRELFAPMRAAMSKAESGASFFTQTWTGLTEQTLNIDGSAAVPGYGTEPGKKAGTQS
ncbi:MAG: phosphogluconate dehydratase [unclassified Hahellaceae]|nr:phosphogluconate dehydratase [Hahellaceae bacterium]